MDKYIGKKLDGRYEITELIGVGGMAEVYKGVDVIDNKPVAIKILKKEYAENEEFLRRFRNESKAIAVLSHPNIVKIYDVGFSDKLQYIVMEYIDGITLKEYIEDEKVISWKETVHFIIQILRALQHAHDKGIVHRDIKPQNIMMFSDGTIKVMDFGIAKFAREEGKTATDQAIGSVHYISPEQASGAVTDAKSDIYSVGAMMYEMLSGQKPFDSDNPVAIAVMHMHDIPVRPKAINGDIPDGLEEIVLKAMEKAPEDRYRNTGEMIADIEKFKANPNIVFGYYQEEDEVSSDSQLYTDPADIELPPAEEPVAVRKQSYATAGGDGRHRRQQPAYGNAYNNDDYYDDDDDDDEEEERSSLVVPVLTAVVVVVIIVGVIVISLMLTDSIKGTKNENDWRMPDVVGMDFNDAVSMYGNNIQFEDEGQEFNEAEPGIIIEQDIEPGTEFKKGDVLKVKISKGMETVEVPDVTQKNAELAKDMLDQIGLKAEIRNSSSTDVQKGYVIKTEPEAGQQAYKNSTIIVYVSIGQEAGQLKVDDWVGKTIEDATKLAEYKGLKVKPVPVASYEEEGIVVNQSIKKGEKVETGTTIEFEYSNGKSPDGEIPFQVELPGDAVGIFTISFILQNEDGTMNTQQTPTFSVPEYATITFPVVGSGENVSVQVILTNMVSQERANIGTYKFNFADNVVDVISGDDIRAAFELAGGFPAQPTEPQTQAPTTPTPTNPPVTDPPPVDDRQPGVNGIYGSDGVWYAYIEYVNGEWAEDGSGWIWYNGFGPNGGNGQW